MKKPRQYSVTLIEEGVMRPELHYGIFARDWWVPRPIENEDNNACSFSIPYRLYMRVTCILKQQQFLIAVVQNETNPLQPGFICTSGDIMSEICLQPSTAVNIVYNQIFQTKTEHSGPAVLGFNNEVIVKKLLHEVEFQPLFLKIGQYLVVVSNVGDSNGNGFVSSLMITKKGKRNLVSQQIIDNKFILDFYQGTKLILHYEDESSDNIWKQIGIKQQENGSTLFGSNHTLVLQKREQTPNNIVCTPNEWNLPGVLDQLFNQNVRKRKIGLAALLDWKAMFQNLLEQDSTIFEFNQVMNIIYSSNYKLQDKDIRAWKAMLQASGCTNITPYSNKESQLEFWSRAVNSNADCATIKMLYKNGFLQLINNSNIPVIISNNDRENIFWNSFRDAYWNANKRGIYGRIRILSIISEKFTYTELQKQLQVSIILIYIDFEYLTYYNFLK